MAIYSTNYLRENFYLTTLDLVTGEGDARSRVEKAYHRFWTIPVEDFPQHLKKNREEIEKLLTRLEGREGYIIPDNLHKMKNKTASKIATNVLTIYLGLLEIKENI